MFLEQWRRDRQLHRAARHMASARRRGVGVYTHDWEIPEDQTAVESIVDWCRHVLGQSRRPWGIDLFDLAIACGREGQVSSRRFLRLQIGDLYGEDVPGQLATFLFGNGAQAGQAAGPLRVTAALFSWGDAAHAALPPAS